MWPNTLIMLKDHWRGIINPHPSGDRARHPCWLHALTASSDCLSLHILHIYTWLYVLISLKKERIQKPNLLMYVPPLQYPFSENSGGKWLISGRFVCTLVTFDGFLPHFLPALCIKLSFNKSWWTRHIVLSPVLLLGLGERGRKVNTAERVENK